MNHSGPVMRFTRIVSHALIFLVPFAALCLITIAYSRSLGLTNDEPWSLYSSPIIEQGKSWQRTRIDIPGFPIVLLSGPYHGALKTNLFTPLLAVTRNIDIIRAANAALMLFLIPIYLWGSKPLEVNPLLNKLYALTFVFLFPFLYMNAPLDTGQFIVPSLLLAVALSATIHGQITQQTVYYWISYVAALLVVYEKLTNLCFAIPVCAYSLYWLLRNRFSLKTLIITSALPVIIASPYLHYFARGGWHELTAMTGAPESSYLINLGHVLGGFMSKVLAFGMIDFYRAKLIDAPTFQALAYLLTALVILSGVVTVVEMVADRKSSSFAVQTRAQSFLWFVLITSVLTQAAVDGLNRPWHFYLYWTIAIFIIGVALQQFLRLGQLRKVVIPTALIGAVIAGACFAQTASFLKNRQAVGTASPLISDVASFLGKDRKKISLVCVNYSVCLPLILLLKNAAIGGDYAFAPKGEGLMAQIDRAMAEDDSLLILRDVDIHEKQKWLEFLNEGTRYFLEHADKNKYRQIKSFDDGRGTKFTVFEREKGS